MTVLEAVKRHWVIVLYCLVPWYVLTCRTWTR
jgi:hypothetical protein